MSDDDLLGLARRGDLDALGECRVAVASAVEEFARAGDAGSALELFGRAWRIWFVRGEVAAGSAVAATALAVPGGEAFPESYTRALYADGLFAFRAGDQQRSLARNEEALRVARDNSDPRGECDALTGLARVALRDGRYDDVIALASAGRDRARTAGDRAAEAAPLHLEAAGMRLQGDYATAREVYHESLELNAALGNPAWVSMEQHNLGWVELHLGNVDKAAGHFSERDAHESSDPYGDAWAELNWSAVALARGDAPEAQRRFAVGREALRQLGVALDPDDQSELDWLEARLAPPVA